MSDTLAQPTITVMGGSLPENTQGTPITTSAYTCNSLTLGINEYDLQFTNTDTWQWESSPAGTPSWTPITGATSTTYVATKADYGVGAKLFRVRVTRNGNTQYSTNIVSANFVAPLSAPTLTFDTSNSTLFKKHVTATVSGADPNLPPLYKWYAQYVVAGATQDTILVKSSLDNYYDLTWRDFLRYGGEFTGNITGVSDGGNGTVIITSDTPIELVPNDVVTIEGTTSYDGRYVVSTVASDYLHMPIVGEYTTSQTGKWSGENQKQINLTCVVSYAGMDMGCTSPESSSMTFTKWVEGCGSIPTFFNSPYVVDPKDIRITSATITSCTSNNQAGLSFSNVTTNLNLSTGATVGPFNWYDASYIGTSSNTSGASSALSDAVVLLDYTTTEPQTVMSATVMLDSPVTSIPTRLLIASPEGEDVLGTSDTVTVSNAGVPTAYTYTFSPSVWLPAGTQFWLILQAAVPPTGGRAGHVYALFYSNNGTPQQSLWRSDGEGKVWTRATCAGADLNAGAGAELMAANGYLYASGGVNLMRSSDGGESFVSIQPPEAQYCMGVCAKPGSPSVLCMLDYYNHIHVSSDGGNTWYPPKATPQTYITVPCNVKYLYWPYPGTLYTLGDGIAVSHDDGQSWALLRYGDANLRVLYFPSDPSLPPWGAYTGTLWRGQMVNGVWNGCFEGETWVDPATHTKPGGTPVNYLPSAFTSASVPWILFHPDRIIALGTSSLAASIVYKSYVDVSANTIALSNHGWVTNQIVRYRKKSGDALQPLVDGQDYFVIYVDANHIKLSLTKDGPAIDLTTQGNDTQTLGLAQGGILTAPASYIAAGTPVWTPAEIETGVDFGHGWIDPNNPSYVWASRVGSPYTYGGVWRSLDGGQTWAQANTGIELMAETASAYGNPTLVSDGTPVPGPLIPVAYGGPGQYKYHFMSDGNPYVAVSITGNGTTATATTAAPHLLPDGNTNVIISDTGNSDLDGLQVATKIDNVTFTFPSIYNGNSISGKMSYWLTYHT